ncbi:MAG: penicillin-binding protein 2 [Alphaproteobacteria bacterium]|nr:penicillin-binding protein 2 [Alphaproteobacteria bacterium]
MNKEKDHVKVFTRRAFVVVGAQGALLGVLGARLAWLQISEGPRYRTLSDKNRINIKIQAPARGHIVDRFGAPLAVNNPNFRALIIPEQAQSVEQSLRALQKIIDFSEKELQDVLKQAKKSAKFIPVEVMDDLSWDDVTKIEVNLPDLPGLSTQVGERRSYPFGEATAHLVGYVGAVSKSEIGEDPLLRQPGFQIGKSGLEKRFDSVLRGESGTSEVEVNVVGREVRELKNQPSNQGGRITLTIDGELQRFAQNRLSQERSASAIVMDAITGAVYALSSVPAFDPNAFNGGIALSLWEELLANPAHPLTNKAVAGLYPPASTFKMITAMAGMKAGLVDPSRTVYCKGYYEFGNGRFHCWKKGGHGYVDVRHAILYSCDTFFYDLATKVGIERIAEMARAFGLGSKLGFELDEERSGLVPDPKWKKGKTGKSWMPGETIIVSIGQGYLQVTPLQLAVMTARLVNGGRAVKPWVTAGGLADNRMPETGWPLMDIDPAHLAIVKEGMDMVVNEPGGTAYGSRIKEPELAMGGKTGTAQVQRITMAQRAANVKNEDLSWEQRHHALFVGYAPIYNPRYVCAVVVDHGIGGSRTAAPIARDLLTEVQRRNPAESIIHFEDQGAGNGAAAPGSGAI